MFQFPQAVGVGPSLLCPGALGGGFLLETYKTPFVVEDPFGILEFHLEVVFLFTISAPVIEEVAPDFTRLLDGLG
jgi:hypothetical protein